LRDQIILGVDPGTAVTGYGIIQVSGSAMTLIKHGVIETGIDDHPMKLKVIFEGILAIIDEYHPDELAVEAPFFGKNVQSMLKLGRAQGVSMAAALYRNIPITEYSPKKIKQSITGNGNASKEQVAAMLQQLLKFKNDSLFLDATDGLAAAVCHYLQNNIRGKTSDKKHTGWKAFLADNPSKLHQSKSGTKSK
jgi:crossover junction endodeoxyribonuclease RuvC